uniref:Retrotransposon gag domain-containing protein n=1 Tax=Cajanus cajan TaxID=3821 RepID=A0A151TEU3_CAJCA|nr:hypothetical protein KK1_011752 [Cajanus cajan]
MLTKNNPFQSWVGFTRALEMEFGSSPYECPRSTLFKLTQTGLVQEYYKEFTALANCVYGVNPDALLDCFLSGLQPDIRRDVIAQAPNSMIRTVSLAKLYKEKYSPQHRTFQTHSLTKNPSYSINQTHKTTSLPPLLPTPTSNQPTQPQTKFSNVKNLTVVKIKLRTCYYRLKGMRKKILEPEPPDNVVTEFQELSLEPHLSFNALNGGSGVGTMKFQGSINGIVVGPHVSDYSELSLKFYLHGNFITLHGEKPKLPMHAQFNHICRMHRTHAISGIFTMQLEVPYCADDLWLQIQDNIEPDLALLLHTYKDVFLAPQGLPPTRTHDHSIPLLPNTKPIKALSVLKSRTILKDDQPVNQVLIQWEGLEESHATWEDYAAIKETYLDFNLEDKVDFNGGGNVICKDVVGAIKEPKYSEEATVSGYVHVARDPNDAGNRKSTRA